MPDFNVRSDAVNVEQIMEQIRSRIREKRGADYTEAQIRELASVKLEKFLDPRGVRSDLLEQFRRTQPPYAPPELPNFAFEDQTLFESTRGPLRFMRKLLLPILKLFFNPNPLIQALNIQSTLNASAAEREAKRDAARYAFDQLHYEVMHNLVLETTRLGIEVKNVKMRLESLASRLEFNERRARALESVVAYKPADEGKPEGRREETRREDTRRDEPRRDDSRRQERQERRAAEQPSRPAPPPAAPAIAPAPAVPVVADVPDVTAVDAADGTPAQAGAPTEGPGQRSRRRRRRRGRRGSGSAAALMAGGQPSDATVDGDGGSDDEGGPEGETDESTPDQVAEVAPDGRVARPEPFEHTFGAQAHPAETAASDPAAEPAAPPAPAAAPSEPSEPEQPQADPAATPEP